MNYTIEDLLVLPGQGKQINNIFIAIGTQDTGGSFSAMKVTLDPHQLLPPHTHDTEDQAVYVISGELEFEVGGEGGLRFTAPADSFVRKPAGVEHCFWNATDTPCQYIELNAGERFQKFVEAIADGPMQAVSDSDKKYGVTINFARVPGLLAEHRLTCVAAMDMPRAGMPMPKLG